MTAPMVPPGLELDVGNLAAFDGRVGQDGTLLELARDGVEALVHAVFSLPAEMTDAGKLADMPEPSFQLPREKPIPKVRAMTKWKKFAQEKGIQKKRRDRLVYDEAMDDFVPRYGKGSKNSLDRDVILLHKEGMELDADPFAAKRKAKNARIKDNKKKHLSNQGRAEKNRKSRIEPLQSLDVAPRGPSGKRNIPKKGIRDAISVAQRSTASAGRFDKRVNNEPKPKLAGRKRKFEAVAEKGQLVREKERTQQIAQRVLLGKGSGKKK